MPFADIIVIAAVAAFILLRYRSMLGEKSGRDPSELTKREQELERIIQLPHKPDGKPLANDPHATYDASLRDTLNSFRKLDPDFNSADFLEGAKGAFEMLITAYREDDHDTLKMLLSDKLYESFSKAKESEQKQGIKSQNMVTAITKAEITDAKLSGNQATIAVQFVSDQIQLVRDNESKIVEGSASEEIEIDDNWKFTRDLRSVNPNWTIIET